MKGLVLCNRGIEEVTCIEIDELLGEKCEKSEEFVIFDFKNKEELCKLAYLGQSIKKVLLVLEERQFESFEKIIDHSKKILLKDWLNSEKSFKVDALSFNDEINAEELKIEVGGAIIESISEYKQNVSMNNPDVVVFVVVTDSKVFYCVDFSGKDLSKREYRIYSHPKNIKATIAYAMVRWSGYKKGEKLIDPFCLSGGIPIETSLYLNNFSHNFFDKDTFLFNKFMKFDFESADRDKKEENNIIAIDSQFRNVDAARKNSKIAGVNKTITFSRVDVNWLDTKFDEGCADRIVTCLPNIGKYGRKEDFLKMYREFFYQADFVLNKKGTIVLCTLNPGEVKEAAREKGFKTEFEREVWQGNEKLNVLKFVK